VQADVTSRLYEERSVLILEKSMKISRHFENLEEKKFAWIRVFGTGPRGSARNGEYENK
jgi:hypothetical protein